MNSLKDKKIMIIGGAGFIGSHLADFLVDNVQTLIIVDDFIENSGANEYNLASLKPKKIQIIKDNLDNIESWGSAINEVDILFNLASINMHKESMQNPFLDYQRNAAVHLKFVRFCRELRKPLKIIFTSSRSVYGSVVSNPTKESDLPNPRDFYSMHTLLSEHYYRMSCNENIRVCCVRFSNTFGPRQRLKGNDIGLYGELFRSALTGIPMDIYGTGATLRDTIYIDNLIEALTLIAGTNIEAFSIVNVGGIGVSIHQFADAIQSVISSATIAYKQLPEHLRHIQVGDVILDNTVAVRRFHWTPKLNIKQSVRQTIEFYHNHKNNYL